MPTLGCLHRWMTAADGGATIMGLSFCGSTMSSVMPPLDDDVFGAPAAAEDQQVAKLRLPQYSMESESITDCP